MNCSKHTDIPAVAQCEHCGAGVCAECAENTEELKESHGTLCVECYYEAIDDMAHYFYKKAHHFKRRGIIKIVLYAVGIALLALSCATGLITQPDLPENWFVGIPAGILFMGAYNAASTVISMIKSGKASAFGCIGVIVAAIIVAYIMLAVGVIATPISCIKDKENYHENMHQASVCLAEEDRIENLE